MLRVSVPTLDRWYALGTGPEVVRVGTRRLYRLSSLRSFVDGETPR
ncbi:MAG TPA: hypothetical protein ENJ38_05225 [Rhodospirillales bacterium]|nr:hypothetical protein [Rhodospirillales bacterium]